MTTTNLQTYKPTNLSHAEAHPNGLSVCRFVSSEAGEEAAA